MNDKNEMVSSSNQDTSLDDVNIELPFNAIQLGTDGELLGDVKTRSHDIHLTATNNRERRWVLSSYDIILLQYGAWLLYLAIPWTDSANPINLGMDWVYLSFLILMFLPPLIPIAVYFYWLNRSDYVALHALQALYLFSISAILILPINLIDGSIITFITGIYPPLISSVPMKLIVLLILLIIWAWPLLIIATLIIGILRTAQGKVFLLPLIGKRIEWYLRNWYLVARQQSLTSNKKF